MLTILTDGCTDFLFDKAIPNPKYVFRITNIQSADGITAAIGVAQTWPHVRKIAHIHPDYAYGRNAPEHFIGESMDRFREITADTGVVLRPWLQAFAWRTPSYSPAYVRTQVSVAKNKGGIGFLFWNARNDYTKVFPAMVDMRAKPGQFFRGDQVRIGRTQDQTKAAATRQPS